MYYALYLALAVVVVFLAIKLAKYVDLLDKTTKVSGAFIGGVLLAAVTSLPELFTSISAVLIVRENEMVAGNILGSNLFNFAVLGISLLIFFRSFKKGSIGKNHIVSIVAMLVMTGLVALAALVPGFPQLGWISLVSPLLLVVYIVFLRLVPKTEEPGEQVESPITFKQIIFRFVLASVFLVAASIAITYVSDIVADKLSLGKTFAGALLLGVATSLPELSSCLSLCRRGNFNAAYGDILGSNVFNYMILVVADLLSFRRGDSSIYLATTDLKLLLILVVASAACMLGATLIKLFRKRESRLLVPASTATLSALPVVSYILFIVLSMTFA